MRRSIPRLNPSWKRWVEIGATLLTILGGVSGATAAAMVWWGGQAVQANDVQGLKERGMSAEARLLLLESAQASNAATVRDTHEEVKEIRADVRSILQILLERGGR